MSPQQNRGIVVGVDGSHSSTVAVEWAARDAEMRNVPLTLVHVVVPIVVAAEGWTDISVPSDYMQFQEDQARQIIEHAHKIAVETVSPSRAPQVTSEILHGPIVPTLTDLSREAVMVRMAKHQRPRGRSPVRAPRRMARPISGRGCAQGRSVRSTRTPAARTRERCSACGGGQPRARRVSRHSAGLGQHGGRRLRPDLGDHRQKATRPDPRISRLCPASLRRYTPCQ